MIYELCSHGSVEEEEGQEWEMSVQVESTGCSPSLGRDADQGFHRALCLKHLPGDGQQSFVPPNAQCAHQFFFRETNV
jgi:hypothetical protein